jgi:DNA protecting protein DprA
MNCNKVFQLEKEEEKVRMIYGDFFGKCHENFPSNLGQIYHTLIGLYCLGDICKRMRKVAVIGPRSAIAYGTVVARKLAIELVERGFCVVGDMARGIGTCAHKGAIDAGGKMLAVCGNAVDVIHPSENAKVSRRIVASGAGISEFTLGQHANRQTFPVPTCVIPGLCDAIVVVESDIPGGGMITAKHGVEQGATYLRSQAGLMSPETTSDQQSPPGSPARKYIDRNASITSQLFPSEVHQENLSLVTQASHHLQGLQHKQPQGVVDHLLDCSAEADARVHFQTP